MKNFIAPFFLECYDFLVSIVILRAVLYPQKKQIIGDYSEVDKWYMKKISESIPMNDVIISSFD